MSRTVSTPTRAGIEVAICTYQRSTRVARALESVLGDGDSAQDASVYVMQNGPLDEDAAALESRFRDDPRVTFHHDPVAGLSRARNTALELCTAKRLAFLDDDAEAETGWLGALDSAFEGFPEAAIVGGAAVPVFECERPAWLGDELLAYLSAVDWPGPLRSLSEDEWLVGANFAVDVARAREAGGFNESLGRSGNDSNLMSNEETDLSDRMRTRGSDVLWQPAARVRHMIEASRMTKDWLRRRVAWQAISDCMSCPETAVSLAEGIRRQQFHGVPTGAWLVKLRAALMRHDDARRFSDELRVLYEQTVRAELEGGR